MSKPKDKDQTVFANLLTHEPRYNYTIVYVMLFIYTFQPLPLIEKQLIPLRIHTKFLSNYKQTTSSSTILLLVHIVLRQKGTFFREYITEDAIFEKDIPVYSIYSL